METAGRSTVVGVFDNPEHARDAIQALKDMGIAGQDIGVLMKDRGDTKAMAEDTGTRAGEGAATGAIGGGILGGLAGWLVGIGALVIPGVGPFIAAGAFGAALTGAAVGAGVGAVAGALVGMGIPSEEADWYEGEVRSGRTLVTVKAEGRYSEVRHVLSRYGAYDIQSRPAGTRVSTTSDTPVGTIRDFDRWEDVFPSYRSHWQQHYGSMGGSYRWEDYEPGYRYGWEMSSRPEYRGRSWTQVESEFRRDWSTRYRDKPWDRFSDAIRHAWEDMTDRGPRRFDDTDTTRDFGR